MQGAVGKCALVLRRGKVEAPANRLRCKDRQDALGAKGFNVQPGFVDAHRDKGRIGAANDRVAKRACGRARRSREPSCDGGYGANSTLEGRRTCNLRRKSASGARFQGVAGHPAIWTGRTRSRVILPSSTSSGTSALSYVKPLRLNSLRRSVRRPGSVPAVSRITPSDMTEVRSSTVRKTSM